jgi:hypothetical protein
VTYLEMAEKLDKAYGLGTSETTFLKSVLRSLRSGFTLNSRDIDQLCYLYNRVIDGGYEGGVPDE